MSFYAMRRALLLVLVSLMLSSCGGRGSEAPAPTGGLTATAGDAQVVLSWVSEPGVEYWLYYAPTASISTENLRDNPGLRGITNVSSPYVLSGLVNGQTYSFVINGRYDGGPGGPYTPSVAAVPRSAGENWNAGGAMGGADMRAITYGGASSSSAIYLAVGAGGAMYQSSDKVSSASLNWTQITTSGITANLNAAIYTLNRYLVLGDGGVAYYSSDALTWSPATSNTTENFNAVAGSGSRVVAVGNNGTIRYSSDGVTWSIAAVPAGLSGTHLYGVSYTATGLWLAVGGGGTLLSSSDGANWTAVASGTTADLRGVAYRSATTTTITTGSTTTTTTIPAAYVVVGDGGVVLSSTDGNSWTARTSNTTADLQTVTPQLTRFLAVGTGGAVITSPDGLSWTAQTSGTTAALYGVVNAQAQYVAVGAGGVSLYSR